MKSWGRRHETVRAHSPDPSLRVPRGTEWGWRSDALTAGLPFPEVVAPGNATPLLPGLTLWHDGNADALILRRVAPAPDDGAPAFALEISICGFTGGFLSLSQDFPPEGLADLTRSHVIRLCLRLSTAAPVTGYARLNISHGPNIEQVLHGLTQSPTETPEMQIAEFDLAYTDMSEKRLNKIWLDLIFEAPADNRIVLHDLVLSRHFRAEM